MNLVDLIQGQLTDGILGKIAAQSGLGETKAKAATEAKAKAAAQPAPAAS